MYNYEVGDRGNGCDSFGRKEGDWLTFEQGIRIFERKDYRTTIAVVPDAIIAQRICAALNKEFHQATA